MKIKSKFLKFKEKNPNVYEFILFNIMSNVATITNFLTLWLLTSYVFYNLNQEFKWFIFNYKSSQGGLGGFLGFLIAYILSQIVNYMVQKNIVFNSNTNLKNSLPWYILTVAIAGIISVWLPPYVIQFIKPYVGGYATILANFVNLALQVLINYPMLKFVIMKEK